MKNISYDMVKEITKELKKKFKGIQANSYGYCCCGDYDSIHKYHNEDDYVCCKIFKGGLNNQYDSSKGKFNLHDEINYMWYLTTFKLEDIINVMQTIASKYDCLVIPPLNDSECIKIKTIEIKEM